MKRVRQSSQGVLELRALFVVGIAQIQDPALGLRKDPGGQKMEEVESD